MCSRLQIVGCAATLVLAGAGWAQMQPPGQMQTPQGSPPAGVPQGTIPPITGNNPQTQLPDPYITDKVFVRNVAEASATEAHLGRIAQDKASADAVKEFGKQMAEVNTQTAEQLKQAAAALKIDVSAEPRKAKKVEEKLAKLSGADFDRAYTKMAADEQKQTVKEFTREAKSGKEQKLKEYAEKNLPSEQDRQKQAEALAASGTTKQKAPTGN